MISNKISPRRQLANALRRLVAPRRSKLRLKSRIGYAPFPPTMKTQVHLTATIPAAEGMTAEKAKTAALVTASQTFRVPIEVVGVKEVAVGFEVTLRRIE